MQKSFRTCVSLFLLLPTPASAQEVTGKWFSLELEPPSKTVDGKTFDFDEIEGYRFYFTGERIHHGREYKTMDVPRVCTRATLPVSADDQNAYVEAYTTTLYKNERGELTESEKSKTVRYSKPLPFIVEAMQECNKNKEVCNAYCEYNPNKPTGLTMIRNSIGCKK